MTVMPAAGTDDWWDRVVVGDLRRSRARLIELVEKIDEALVVLEAKWDLDREPQPGDGPEYHADHAAWEERQRNRGSTGRD